MFKVKFPEFCPRVRAATDAEITRQELKKALANRKNPNRDKVKRKMQNKSKRANR